MHQLSPTAPAHEPAVAAPLPRRRHWSTQPGDCPGVTRARRRWRVRVCWRRRWLHLGYYVSEWEAARVARLARALRREVAACPTAAQVRRLILQRYGSGHA